MKHYEKLTKLVAELEEDYVKFYEKGNNAAGTRVRKGMQTLKEFAQEIRADVQAIKNSNANK